jgi:hypothetical protein
MSLLDAYERKARLTPGLLAVAPVAFMIVTLGFKKFPAVAVAVAVLSATGGGYALSVLVAHLGRRAQVHLWDSWDGPPTIRFLRTRYEAANPVQREVWRRAIEMTTGVALLTPDAEAADPTLADNTIRTAVDQMRRLGQDPAFPLVAAENTQYGFERNLYGFRWVSRVIFGDRHDRLGIDRSPRKPIILPGLLIPSDYCRGGHRLPFLRWLDSNSFRQANKRGR